MAMASENAHLIWATPNQALFAFPPTQAPPAIPPPAVTTPTLLQPFHIPEHIFSAALDPRVPITIAAAYAITVKLLTRYNLSRGKKAWPISKTRPFFAFVVLHNVFLAVYSAWTFWGMLGGMRRSIVDPRGEAGLAGTADSFCHLHGAAGVGNAVYFDEANGVYASTMGELVGGAPDGSQAGRMWNEGLAYYGWIFYLSKFYEVLDTFIILAKGKPSSTLQTYHHAGAMMCMWAGIRYMSAPIWMFVLVNSFIHSLMYFYYTLTAFSIKVPVTIKRTLTTMQITQFLVGASYAICHSFLSIVAPLTITTESVIPGEPTIANAPIVSIIPTAAASALDSIKSFIFGTAASPAAAPIADKIVISPNVGASQSVSHTIQVSQPCILTSGETFAIWLNVLYLAPLTYLFVSFFITSYVKRSNAASKMNGKAAARRPSNVTIAEKAGWDAARGLEKEIYNGENMVNGHESAIVEKRTPVSTPSSTPSKKKGKRRG